MSLILRKTSGAVFFLLCAALAAAAPVARADKSLTLYVGTSANGDFGSLCGIRSVSVQLSLEDGKFVSKALPDKRAAIPGLCSYGPSDFNYFTGLLVGKYFSVEAGYLGFTGDYGDRSIAISPAASGQKKFLDGYWHSSVLAMLPILENASAYGKIGLATRSNGYTVDDFPINSNSEDVVRLYGVGMEYFFANKFGLKAEWQKVRLSPVLEGGSGEPSYSLGVTYRF